MSQQTNIRYRAITAKHFITVLFLFVFTTSFAQTEKRLALVVGNSEYMGKGNSLANPAHDAEDVSAKLNTLGFDVTTLTNGSFLQMDDAIDAFGRKAKGYDVALFYYSGHGLQSKGDNYLVPVDAELRSDADVRFKCTAVNHLIAKLEESGCPMKIIVLDACRNNPFERSWHRSAGSTGLSFISAPKGTLISYATSPGSTADDGRGRNSPYTTAFLQTLDEPNLSLLNFFNEVGTKVQCTTNEEQIPWVTSSALQGSFYFHVQTVPAPVVEQTPTPALTQPTSPRPSTTQPQPQTVSATVVTPVPISPAPQTDTPSESLTFTVNGVSFVMKRIEGGTFQMGNNDSDADSDERPVHSVTLNSYYMGETEVTQALWKAVMVSNPSYFQGDNLPVEQVSWNVCQKFIRKLNQLTGRSFRLPTEAEWEFAARGGNKNNRCKYAGSNTIGNVAWYRDTEGSTHEVKRKNPNELELYDMTGNVREWCSDRYGNYSGSWQTNPKGPSRGSYRVQRGGSWSDMERWCRVSSRFNSVQDYGGSSDGFRLVLSE